MAARFSAGRVLAIAGIGVGGAAVAIAAAAAAAVVIFARTVIIPPRKREQDVRILASDDATVTVSPTLDSLTPGRYSLWFNNESGHARVGEIISFGPTEVKRALLGVDFGDLSIAKRGRFSGWFYLRPRELGYPFQDVEIETELGPAPAWLIPAERETGDWVIQVHGRGVRRAEALRAVPVFREAGYTSLLVSYRNDRDAPESPDHRYALGDTEWRDVDEALSYALAHGAKNVVLMGWSMGGATVLQLATRSANASVIRGIVLDSPVVDWITALEFQGVVNRLPAQLRRAVLATLSSDWGRVVTGQSQAIDLARLDFVHRAGELTWPILLIHSDDDGFVPATASRALAIARPDIVTYEAFATARHTKEWNYDSDRWNAAIAEWLEKLG